MAKIHSQRTVQNKKRAAARRTRRKAYWQTEEGVKRKQDKAFVRRMKKTMKKEAPSLRLPPATPMNEAPLIDPVMKLDAGTVTGSKAEDVYLSGWENEGGLIV